MAFPKIDRFLMPRKSILSVPARFHRVHVVLGDYLVAAAGFFLERSEVGKRRGRNNNAGGMNRSVAHAAFNFFSEIDDALGIGIASNELA